LRGGVGAGSEKDVGGDTFATVFLEGGGDGGVSSCPVGDKESDVLIAKSGLDRGLGESDSFVHLAGQAPRGSEIDEDGATGGQLAGNFFFGPWETSEGMGGGRFGRSGCFQEKRRSDERKENEGKSD
jgi:hypothetical protein